MVDPNLIKLEAVKISNFNRKIVNSYLFLQGFNLSHTPTRITAMVRPVYSAVVRYGGRLEPKPVLIFVPSRRQTRSLAVDVLTYALADRQENRFCHINPEEDPFKSILERLTVSFYVLNFF